MFSKLYCVYICLKQESNSRSLNQHWLTKLFWTWFPSCLIWIIILQGTPNPQSLDHTGQEAKPLLRVVLWPPCTRTMIHVQLYLYTCHLYTQIIKLFFKKNMWKGSTGKSTFQQAWQPDFNSQYFMVERENYVLQMSSGGILFVF